MSARNFNPSYYAEDWDNDGYDDDTGEWIDDSGGFDNGEETTGFDDSYDSGADDGSDLDTSFDYGYEDTTAPSREVIEGPADTDFDGLTDDEEINGFEVLVTYTGTYTDWVFDDSTGKSWEESIEYDYTVTEMVYTDPNNADSDFDLLPDKWELDLGFNPKNLSDGMADADLDGLSNGEEYLHGTDYLNPDADWDEYFDGTEVLVMQSNPLDENDPEEVVEEEIEEDITETSTEGSENTAPIGGSDGQENIGGGQDTNETPVPGGETTPTNDGDPDGQPPSEETSPQPGLPKGELNIEVQTLNLRFR